MRLKSITLNGFKTFATKTTFEFDERVTVIVGPNGSGKSNIADAVRWVLGEQSYKLLRGRKTVDMIFHGSDERPRAGMASATIVFDNSDGWLPIDFSEVSITRRAYRDGKNEYLINGKQVLLRDVNELLGQSGLAERTYTIIGQGLVDAALALNPDERRSLFEEAAGIGLYRSRREDAEKRLEKTQRNLDRVEDILSELRPRLKSLERQAKRADKYDQVRADLKALMREWYGYHWYRVQEELHQARERESIKRRKLEEAREKQAALDRELSTSQADLQGLRARLNTWHRELSDQHASREEISREHAVIVERIRALEGQQAELETERARLTEEMKAREERLDRIKMEVSGLEEELQSAMEKLEQARKDFNTKETERGSLEADLERAREELARQRHQLSRLQARKEERREQIEHKQTQLEDMAQDMDDVENVLASAKDKLRAAENQRELTRAERHAAEKDLEELREDIHSGEAYLRQLKDKRSTLGTKISRTKAELGVLKEAEKKLAGYAQGTKILLEKARKGKLSGTVGALSRNLEVDASYETAIAAALGEYLDAVILEDLGSVDQALDFLLEETSRGALLPLEMLTPPEPLDVEPDRPGVIGVASRLVDAPPKVQPAIDLLLGQVIIIEEKDEVRSILADQPRGTRAVTLKGEVFFESGQVFAGQEGGTSTLSRSRQRRTWQETLEKTLDERETLEEKISGVSSKIQARKDQEEELIQVLEERMNREERAAEEYKQAVIGYEGAQQQVGWKKSRRSSLREEIESAEEEIAALKTQENERQDQIEALKGEVREKASRLREMTLDAEREKISSWQTEVAVTERALEDARERFVEREGAWKETIEDIDQLRERKKEIGEKIDSLRAKEKEWNRQEDEIKKRIQDIRSLIETSEEKLTAKEEEQARLQRMEAEARKRLNEAERSYAQAEVTLTRRQENLERMQERIREDIGLVELDYDEDVSGPTPLPLEGYVEKLPKKKTIPVDLEKNIKALRRQMRRLGAVNPEAQSEYRDVRERHQFLTEQLSDLRKAEADIKEVIAELEVLMEREFRKTFDSVAGEFRQIFVRLFGGGEGRLVLTDPDDLTRSGVEIEARLPGRRTQGLSLLSGGERSLTAAALIFSLLKVSPTPFCVLDEVDAMLDEANVARYRKLLRELSSETQFIVITHNRNTVQVADVLYGITMAEDSTSRMLSLKLDEVEEVIA